MMAVPSKKRKAGVSAEKTESDIDPGLTAGDLDGAFSEEEVSEENLSDEEEGIEDTSAEENVDDEEIPSDEVPSEDEENIRDQIRQLKTDDGTGESLRPGRRRLDEDKKLQANYRVEQNANGNPRYVYDEINPVYDSDDSDAPQAANTIGNIPLSFYDSYPHIGYDINGKKISRPAKGEALDALLDSIDLPEGWTGLTDPATGKPLNLGKDELDVLRRLTRNEEPSEGYDPYPDMVEWFTSQQEIMPLSAAPEPKRRFIPSKHEQKRVMKIVKAIKEGRIQPYRLPEDREEREVDYKTYDIWADEQPRPDHIMNVPAPKLPPPGYAESYHPPPEYLPDENEKKAFEDADEEDREKDFLPADHSALRKVPGYGRFVKDKFERCLDLYLAPRVRRSKLNIDPESLLPKLPSPDELRPFPTVCATLYRGHEGRVRSVSIDPTGVYVASGGDDGTVRVWELLSGRQVWHARLSTDETVNVSTLR